MANAYERHDISDESWAKIEFLLPGRKGTWGGNARDNRQFINAVFWILRTYAPSEPHGEEEEGFFRVGIYQKDECRRAMMTARRHFPLHNNEPELIDYFVSPLGSANQSVPPEWNSNEAEHLRATCESRCRSLCMSRRTNTG